MRAAISSLLGDSFTAVGHLTNNRMISDPDIYRAAKLLVDQHGEEAAEWAQRRVAQLSDEGDPEGARCLAPNPPGGG
jgi:hypothetical protein